MRPPPVYPLLSPHHRLGSDRKLHTHLSTRPPRTLPRRLPRDSRRSHNWMNTGGINEGRKEPSDVYHCGTEIRGCRLCGRGHHSRSTNPGRDPTHSPVKPLGVIGRTEDWVPDRNLRLSTGVRPDCAPPFSLYHLRLQRNVSLPDNPFKPVPPHISIPDGTPPS